MKFKPTNKKRCLLLTLLMVLATCTNPVWSAQYATDTYNFSELTTLIQNFLDAESQTNASLMIVKGNSIVYEHYFGDYTAQTVIPIRSSAKWLVAGTMMRMVDAGLLGLDQPLADHLPELNQGKLAQITLRHCLSHQTGLPADSAVPSIFDATITMASCVSDIIAEGVREGFDPGTDFLYCSLGLQLAARTAEVIEGKSWNQVFIDRFATPLNMPGATFGANPNPRVAGDASSSLQGYVNFLTALLHDGVLGATRVYSVTSAMEMKTDQNNGATITYSPFGDDRHYGLGCWVERVDSASRAVQFSSPGAYGSWPWMDTERDYLAVFMINHSAARVFGTAVKMQKMVGEIMDNTDHPVWSDLFKMAHSFGQSYQGRYDLNHDGALDNADLVDIARNWH
jgi:CubicO group peptidase (beta-lactamase class C family)